MARLIATLALAALALVAQAQYPSRPIKVLVPQPPGGANDTVTRVIAPALGERLGQPIVVENRPGANGNLAMEVVAKAPADGYTLLLAADAQIVINPHFYSNLPLDTMKDLVPVASVVNTQMVLAVNPSLPVKTLQEFIDYARRANPPLAYASIGNGSQHHLVMEMLKQRAGIDLLHVPFKGGGPATTALIAGEVAAAFGGNSVTGHVRAGRLRALAVAGKTRSPVFPDVPRLAEFYPGLEVTPWLGIFAPAGVPPAVIARLHEATNAALADPATAEKIRRVGGLEPYLSTPDEFSALLRAEYVKYGEVVKAVGAKVD
ncbi:MAG TPA: tripartite tricarboxylate transporter substrate binding protein [Burkholderiales bacterium]|nr:tripartite tricarboxylate transporter substrate binding protein [Burkholderiales bacterium]